MHQQGVAESRGMGHTSDKSTSERHPESDVDTSSTCGIVLVVCFTGDFAWHSE